VVNVWEADDLFREHLYNPAICAMVAQLMGTDTLRVWHDQAQYKPPKIGGSTDWLALAATSAQNTSYLQWIYVGAGVTTRTWTVRARGSPAWRIVEDAPALLVAVRREPKLPAELQP